MKRIVAVLAVCGLLAGVCLYGVAVRGSSGDASPDPVVEVEAESLTPTEVVEEVVPEEPEEVGEIMQEDISGDSELKSTQLDDGTDNSSEVNNTDVLSLLTEYVIEVEDIDGYNIRETIQLSPIFTEDDIETVYALWEALGNSITSFPSKEDLCDQRRALANYQLEYLIGTCTIENLTDGFSFTPDSPRSYAMSFTAKGNDNTATFFNDHSVSAVAYSNGITYYSGISSVEISDAKLTSDAWGPYTFVIALPNMRTPNQPDGYRYDEAQIILDYNVYEPGTQSKQNIFELEYFK